MKTFITTIIASIIIAGCSSKPAVPRLCSEVVQLPLAKQQIRTAVNGVVAFDAYNTLGSGMKFDDFLEEKWPTNEVVFNTVLSSVSAVENLDDGVVCNIVAAVDIDIDRTNFSDWHVVPPKMFVRIKMTATRIEGGQVYLLSEY